MNKGYSYQNLLLLRNKSLSISRTLKVAHVAVAIFEGMPNYSKNKVAALCQIPRKFDAREKFISVNILFDVGGTAIYKKCRSFSFPSIRFRRTVEF